MFAFACSNLLRRRWRTGLSLAGLAMAVGGMICLISLTAGVRATIYDTVDRVHGVIVLRAGSPSPMLSVLPKSHDEILGAIEGVRVVVPELWHPAASVQGRPIWEQKPTPMAILGAPTARRERLQGGGTFFESLEAGRFIAEGDRRVVVVPRALLETHGLAIGNSIEIIGESFEIIGVFHTGSPLLDACLLLPFGDARRLSGKDPDYVSCYFIETQEPGAIPEVVRRIKERLPDTDAMSLLDWGRRFSDMLLDLDLFLALIASLALVVGAFGVLNTMMMSVSERLAEFGILRATGWRSRDVLLLVLLEAGLLGLCGGLAGCILGACGVGLIRLGLPIQPAVPWWLPLLGLGTALVLGWIGGLLPARQAARQEVIANLRNL